MSDDDKIEQVEDLLKGEWEDVTERYDEGDIVEAVVRAVELVRSGRVTGRAQRILAKMQPLVEEIGPLGSGGKTIDEIREAVTQWKNNPQQRNDRNSGGRNGR